MKQIHFSTLGMFSALLISSHAWAATVPNYILKKALSLIEGSVEDTATGLITRAGESVASSSHVEKDEALSLSLTYYADELQPLQQTRQVNHLRGEEHIGGGAALENRRFSFYDYEIWDYDPDYGILFNGQVERKAGLGIGVPENTDTLWVAGVTKYWDSKYVVHSRYSNSGGEGLRRPGGTFVLQIEYKLADLSYDADHSLGGGMVSAERHSYDFAYESVSKIQQDKVTNVDLLEDNTEIVDGPYAYGECKRIWKLNWPDISYSEIPPLSSPSALVDKLINEHEWTVHELSTDYGW